VSGHCVLLFLGFAPAECESHGRIIFFKPTGGLMQRTGGRWAYSLRASQFLLAGILSALPVAAQTQPTSSQDAEAIDQTWRHASSKYDAQRNALLKEVNRAAHDGPYRADWQSLQKYEVPDWYKDAKFGIFF